MVYSSYESSVRSRLALLIGQTRLAWSEGGGRVQDGCGVAQVQPCSSGGGVLCLGPAQDVHVAYSKQARASAQAVKSAYPGWRGLSLPPAGNHIPSAAALNHDTHAQLDHPRPGGVIAAVYFQPGNTRLILKLRDSLSAGLGPKLMQPWHADG